MNASDLRVRAGTGAHRACRRRVHLTLGATRWNLRPPRIARMLELPADGRRELRIGGAGASAWFTALAKRVDRPPTDADWAISSKSGVRVIPDRPGYVLDVPRSAKAVLRAALVTEPELRSAKLTVERRDADRTTAEAQGDEHQGARRELPDVLRRGGEPHPQRAARRRTSSTST